VRGRWIVVATWVTFALFFVTIVPDALGVDAFRVAQSFADGTPPEKLEFDGATGHLSLEPSHQFAREAMVMQFRAGAIVPAGNR